MTIGARRSIVGVLSSRAAWLTSDAGQDLPERESTLLEKSIYTTIDKDSISLPHISCFYLVYALLLGYIYLVLYSFIRRTEKEN